MSKRKRERMKEKVMRHKGKRPVETGAVKPASPAAEKLRSSTNVPDVSSQPHLMHASPEWKRFYAEVSRTFSK